MSTVVRQITPHALGTYVSTDVTVLAGSVEAQVRGTKERGIVNPAYLVTGGDGRIAAHTSRVAETGATGSALFDAAAALDLLAEQHGVTGISVPATAGITGTFKTAATGDSFRSDAVPRDAARSLTDAARAVLAAL